MAICGIYWIQCVPTSRFYIGRSADIATRIYHHFWSLGVGDYNLWPGRKQWQEDYDRHGIDNFVIVTVQECDPVDLIQVEQAYLDFYKESGRLYNTGNATFGRPLE